MRKPDLFVVGHPRSGSGQLNGYLSKHPDIWMAKKELHYFGRDLGYHDPPRSLQNFESFFEDAPSSAERVGEASTWYLFSESAAQEIHDYCPSAGIVMLLRNPISLLHSLHSHFVFRGDEDIADFGAALAAEEGRREGSIAEPPHRIPREALRYSKMVRYAPQVKRYFEVFGREAVHVVINDDFREDPKAVFRGVCRYLDVREDFEDFERVFDVDARARNSNRTVHFRGIQDYLIHPARQQVLEGLRRSTVPGYRFSLRAMRRLNIKYVDRGGMDPSLKRELQERYRPWVDELSELLDRDLSHWCGG
ncbi:MAG TPA: hypothetical protein QGF58_10730 [Myxococcota bacterium]|nr:hypothetical protein [Myxococcota bacterium]